MAAPCRAGVLDAFVLWLVCFSTIIHPTVAHLQPLSAPRTSAGPDGSYRSVQREDDTGSPRQSSLLQRFADISSFTTLVAYPNRLPEVPEPASIKGVTTVVTMSTNEQGEWICPPGVLVPSYELEGPKQQNRTADAITVTPFMSALHNTNLPDCT